MVVLSGWIAQSVERSHRADLSMYVFAIGSPNFRVRGQLTPSNFPR